MSEVSELLVIKGKAYNNPDLGFLDIIFVINSENEIVSPSEDEFPTLGIWISKGYEQIDSQYKENELFRITRWDVTTEDKENIGQESRHRHWALGSSAKSLEPSFCLPVYRGSMPDKKTGIVKIQVTYHSRPFFFEKNNYIYGPFSFVEKLDDGGVKVSPYQQPYLNISNNHVYKIDISHIAEFLLSASRKRKDHDIQYITSLKKISRLSKDILFEEDFISDEQLVSYFSKGKFGAGKKNLIARKEAEKLKQGISEARKLNEINNDDRTRRIKSLLDDYLNTDFGKGLIDEFLDSKKGRDFLSGYIDSEKGLIEKYSDEAARTISEEKEKIKSEIVELEEKVKDLHAQESAQKNRVVEAKRKYSEEIGLWKTPFKKVFAINQ